MKQYTIETPDGYKAVETEVDNGFLIHFVKEEKYEPKEGDICALDFKCSGCVKKLIFCLKNIIGRGSSAINYYFGIDGGGYFGTGGYYGYHDGDTIRPATTKEQKQLFDALAKAGKMWNSDKKEIVDVPKKEKFEPKDGDVVYFSDDRYTWVGIYSKKINNDYYPYALYCSIGRKCESDEWELEYKWNCRESDDIFRPATPEEQKQLFDALAKAGKMWNSDKKEIVDVPKKGDILKWTGFDEFVGVFLGLSGNFEGYARMFDPKREDPYRPNSCWIPYLVEPTESEKEECLADLKKLGKRIDENGDIVDLPKLLVPDHIEIYQAGIDIANGDGLYISSDDQLLYYNSHFHVWGVCPLHDGYKRVKCELVKCDRGDLKAGDTFLSTPSGVTGFEQRLYNYNKYLKDGRFAHFSSDGDGIIVREYSGDIYKLIPING